MHADDSIVNATWVTAGDMTFVSDGVRHDT
jgi:hypothetical protein